MKKAFGPRVSEARAMVLNRTPGFWTALEAATAFLGRPHAIPAAGQWLVVSAPQRTMGTYGSSRVTET